MDRHSNGEHARAVLMKELLWSSEHWNPLNLQICACLQSPNSNDQFISKNHLKLDYDLTIYLFKVYVMVVVARGVRIHVKMASRVAIHRFWSGFFWSEIALISFYCLTIYQVVYIIPQTYLLFHVLISTFCRNY